MKLTRRSVNLGLTASLVTPVFSRVARAAGETIKIGMVTRSRRHQGNGRFLRTGVDPIALPFGNNDSTCALPPISHAT